MLDLASWVTILSKHKGWIGFDTETTGLDVYDGTDKMLGFSIGLRTEAGILAEYFPVNHEDGNNLTEYEWHTLMDIIITLPIVCHNLLFDSVVLRNSGYEVSKGICTMKFAHLLDENYKQYDLDSVSARYLGRKGKEKSALFELALQAYGWAGMPADIMHDYAKADAFAAIETLEAQLELAKKRGEDRLLNYIKKAETPSIIGLGKMRQRGVLVDLETCRREEERGVKVMEELTEQFGFNPGSSVGLNKLLIEELGLPVLKRNKPTAKNPEGGPSFDKATMKDYDLILQQRAEKENDPEIGEIARRLFTFRGWQKSVTGYYRPYQNLVSDDGYLRAEYKPHGTVTGRFSCANPNLQQIPKETDKEWNGRVKECLGVAPGYVGIEFDYSQLEFRLAAAAAGETKLLDIFADPDRDIFDEMSLELDMVRQDCKTQTYSIQYGGGVNRIKTVFDISAAEAKARIDNFYYAYPRLLSASQQMSAMAKAKGYVDIWSGRRRHFKYPKTEYYKAFNSYVQGGAADIVKVVMNRCFRNIDNDDCMLLLQVHDSLVWAIREDKIAEYVPRIKHEMTAIGSQFGVRLDVDAHYWSHRESLKTGGLDLAA